MSATKRPYAMTSVAQGVAAIVFWDGARYDIVRPYITSKLEEAEARRDTVRLNDDFDPNDLKRTYQTALRHAETRARRNLRWWKMEVDYWQSNLDALKDAAGKSA